MIGKLSQILVFSGRAAAWATLGSSRTPFDMNLKMKSSKGLKSYDLGGVGLGIVVALDNKSSEIGRETLPKHAVSTTKLNRSRPIQVQSMKDQHGFHQKGVNEIDVGSSEDYTYVTKHVANRTITRVYYDGGEDGIVRHNNVGVFRRTPPTPIIVEPEPSFPTSDFLTSCHLCRKKLHGKDIYMYRYYPIPTQYPSCSKCNLYFIG
ncbi:putative Zf-FLZ domain-containing protein [Lupinus albus]|uniref:Putative Zf-FLZ domain-containing protein n=1 Tax=Lupinus albus TaxID=3870 RepID=A0A6A4PTM8_LUPAL|nr:putative Zf-FLZ domain-containing protein [Lupinus albus]